MLSRTRVHMAIGAAIRAAPVHAYLERAGLTASLWSVSSNPDFCLAGESFRAGSVARVSDPHKWLIHGERLVDDTLTSA